jgi:hypothetical protein
MDTPEKPKRGRPRLPESERKTHVTMFMPPKLVELVKRLGAERGIGFGPLVSQALSEHFADELAREANTAACERPLSLFAQTENL